MGHIGNQPRVSTNQSLTLFKVEDNYWLYDPVKGASIVFAILFAASGLFHGYQNG
jgi:hypothetical protein